MNTHPAPDPGPIDDKSWFRSQFVSGQCRDDKHEKCINRGLACGCRCHDSGKVKH